MAAQAGWRRAEWSRRRSTTPTPGTVIRTCTPMSWSPTASRPPTGSGGRWTAELLFAAGGRPVRDLRRASWRTRSPAGSQVGFGWRDRGPRRTAGVRGRRHRRRAPGPVLHPCRGTSTGHLQDLVVDFHAEPRAGADAGGDDPAAADRHPGDPAGQDRARAWSDLLTAWASAPAVATGREPERPARRGPGRQLRPAAARARHRPELAPRPAGIGGGGGAERRSTWNGWNLEAEIARLTKPLRWRRRAIVRRFTPASSQPPKTPAVAAARPPTA